jgi:hypothetical protein
MAYRSSQRPTAQAQARVVRVQAQQQQKMLRVTGVLVGVTLAVSGLLTILQRWL